MAYQLQDDNVFELKIFTNDGKQNGINVIHYKIDSVVGGALTDQQAADAFSALVAVPYKAYLPATCQYAGVQARVNWLTPQPTVRSVVDAGAGVNVSDRLPGAVALLLSPRTLVAGRSGRGRCYLPFWSEDYNATDGTPNADAITDATAVSNVIYAVRTITSGGNSARFTPIIFGKGGTVQYAVSSVLLRQEWATQRRRSGIRRPDQIGP